MITNGFKMAASQSPPIATEQGTTTKAGQVKLVAPDSMRSFCERCLTRAGADSRHSASLSELLLAADTRGHYSHGLNRLEMYVKELQTGLCDGKAVPAIVKETPATAYVNGNNGIGPVVGTFCMDLAIKKAKDVGLAWVNCIGSNHYGIAGWYAIRAAKEGLIGVSMTNTSPLVVPTRGREKVLGTNPIAFAAPATNGDCFVLDMATSTAALGKVELCLRKGTEMPRSWGVNPAGEETTHPASVMEGGGLMPLGGAEQTAGYKGYGLAAMVEVLCGVLGGGPFAHHIRSWTKPVGEANLGQSFMAMNPDCFAPDFQERLQTMIDELRSFQPVDPDKPVLVAGDPERMHTKRVEQTGFIPYPLPLITALNALATKLQVEPIQVQEELSH